jgi:plastocyanin
VNINFSYWILASVSAVSFFGLGLAGMSDFSALAQGTAEGTIVSMAKGSQSADNPKYYVPAETAVNAGETVTWKNDDTAIHTATSGKDATPDGRFDTSLVRPARVANL